MSMRYPEEAGSYGDLDAFLRGRYLRKSASPQLSGPGAVLVRYFTALQANDLACLDFMALGRRYETSTSESETKNYDVLLIEVA